MRHVAILLAAAFLPHGVHAAPACTELVPNPAGHVEVEAAIPAFTPLCYAFAPRSGQEATIRVSTGDRMNFGLESVQPDGQTRLLVDRRQTYTLKAEAQAYRLLVASEELHPDTTHRFTLVIEVK